MRKEKGLETVKKEVEKSRVGTVRNIEMELKNVEQKLEEALRDTKKALGIIEKLNADSEYIFFLPRKVENVIYTINSLNSYKDNLSTQNGRMVNYSNTICLIEETQRTDGQ